MNIIDKITEEQIRTDLPEFRVGDTIKVGYKIKEGSKERIQAFEGIVMKIQNAGVGKTFTVRKISGGIGVERTFPMNSPLIDSIEITKHGKVRQAKLNYIRNITGKVRIKPRNLRNKQPKVEAKKEVQTEADAA